MDEPIIKKLKKLEKRLKKFYLLSTDALRTAPNKSDDLKSDFKFFENSIRTGIKQIQEIRLDYEKFYFKDRVEK